MSIGEPSYAFNDEKSYLQDKSSSDAKQMYAYTRKSRKDYTSDGVSDNDIFSLPASDWQLVGILTILGSFVRLFKIYQPSSVVFDEVHFGGFASKYIKGKFFMDVHPPLAKLLITLFGWLGGFDGKFDFKEIGKDYLEPGVPYVAMRMLPALCGIATIPIIFLTLKAAGCRTATAAAGSILVIFENALITQSRLILLDSPLVVFTALTAFSWTCFTNQHELGPEKAFEPLWWFWLSMTGLCLGATVSVKWVGLFTIGWVGSLTILQLWVMLGDTTTITPRLWFKHFFARAFCLIMIPITFYMAMFAIHFVCLVNPGDGDGFMSSEFQATLNNKGMNDVPVDVAFGSRVSIRHYNTQGGYLHSHNHMYPGGSKQQQITLYPHKDQNNIWLLENQTLPEGPDGPIEGLKSPVAWDELDPVMVKNGAIIKLYHKVTHRRLHSHDVRPPVTEADWQNEASAYGYEGFDGDANDLFKVAIVKSLSDGPEAQKRVRTIQTKFRLIHLLTGCALFSHKVKLPEWGFEQQEVTCAKQGTLPNSIWYVESNEHPQLGESAEKVNYRKPGFFGKFWELQKVMWRTNAGLVESHAWDSRPSSWPMLRRGINFWGRQHRQIYLLGNPIIWWSSTAAIAIYAIVKGLAILRWQRGYNDYQNNTFKRFDYEIGTSVLGWAFHYFPFYLMKRQLFLHHYLPALYFAILALCQLKDFITARFSTFGMRSRPALGQSLIFLLLAFSIVSYTTYAPLTYGSPWTKQACRKVKLVSSWDFDCNNFFTNYEQYYNQTLSGGSNAADIPSSPPPKGYAKSNKKKQKQQQMLAKAKEAKEQQGTEVDPNVTPQAKAPAKRGKPKKAVDLPEGQRIVKQEEVLEHRDQDGNLLNEEQVAELKGKVSFKTRYETRTRLVDADGNEIVGDDDGGEDDEAVPPPLDQPQEQPNGHLPDGRAPPHPDVEGQNPETADAGGAAGGKEGRGKEGDEAVAADQPPTVGVEEDLEKEKIVEEGGDEPMPASEGNEAT